MKKIWVGTSWKMNKDAHSAEAWASAVAPALKQCSEHVQPFVIPPFPYLTLVSELFKFQPIRIGAQNICWQDSGAFTGEVSPVMAKDCGASIVEIGHSERRAMFGETDKTVNLKVKAALKHDLTPLVCVGDSAEEKEWGVSAESVIRQVKIALYGIEADQLTKVVIAYEPVWAIGEHGTPATKEEAETIHCAIRHALAESYGHDIARDMVLVYGGSVNLANASELLEQDDIDGIFVGRTAWDAQGYAELLSIANSQVGA
ncbi:triose-phosphate isomerase [Vibrio europaeus]|uniref:Triosephosphate isomerase n=1 Tax=Vibrio europaeus TaxID=300876 RepID=A0AAE7AXT1_9VIBR|nr:triose-phosphate isomerase [Vibrio europaeus]MDC5805779.1 triose-phosphate isomerase [Vibrio europaeus]MDC5812076.1 triose-phosphate isomerase [Vibrio europaeus]MDC5826147.1 triose-phosphate isomerase [Vibrio europaeus]MDC5831512.1 triose-phosphate isomerase [Vibrio europaeus]MDC5834467.1 triose-phosphate isomerase [Vibrio europaeus]